MLVFKLLIGIVLVLYGANLLINTALVLGKKYKISEISIQLPYRKLGSSKMKIKDIIHAFYSLFLVYIKSLVNFYDT